MAEDNGSANTTEKVKPTIAEMINRGMSSVSALVASYTKAVQKEEKELTSLKDRETEDRVSDISS